MKVKFIKTRSTSLHSDEIFFLKLGKTYQVLARDNDDYYRIINENSEPILYESDCFEIIDPKEPDFWVENYFFHGENTYRYAHPEGWGTGFFEKYFDVYPDVREKFWIDCKKLYNINVTLTKRKEYNRHYPFNNDEYLKVKCISKRACLEKLSSGDEYEFFVGEEAIPKICLTVNKIYNVDVMIDFFWYKIKDDKGENKIFPKYIFEDV
jgi:hypothetical protein